VREGFPAGELSHGVRGEVGPQRGRQVLCLPAGSGDCEHHSRPRTVGPSACRGSGRYAIRHLGKKHRPQSGRRADLVVLAPDIEAAGSLGPDTGEGLVRAEGSAQSIQRRARAGMAGGGGAGKAHGRSSCGVQRKSATRKPEIRVESRVNPAYPSPPTCRVDACS
jgi:hypothetical protein